MIRLIIYIAVFFCLETSMFAQSAAKINLQLLWHLAEAESNGELDEMIDVLIKGDLSIIQSSIRAMDGHYKTGIKDIASVRVAGKHIYSLSKIKEISRIEARKGPAGVLNDKMIANNNADSVFLGLGDFPEIYDGTDVIVGIIDDGFEWAHEDLQDAGGNTRFLSIWDQTIDTIHPEPIFGYGVAYNTQEIEQGMAWRVRDFHGAHVTGIAAGNGSTVGKYRGIAPNSNIVGVKIGFGDDFFQQFADAVAYIYQYAATLGKPCSINSSVGSYFGSHDAKDLAAQLVEYSIEAANGRSLTQAIGNAGNIPFHLGTDLLGNTAKTWFKYNPDNSSTDFVLYSDSADMATMEFEFDLIDDSNFQVLGSSTSYRLSDFNLTNGIDSIQQILFFDTFGNPVELKLYVENYNNVIELWVTISSAPTTNYWQLNVSGYGRFDVWSHPLVTGTSEIEQNPGNTQDYLYPDHHQTMVSSWACSEKVITVGIYQNRTHFDNYAGGTTTFTATEGEFTNWSSRGPSRTGILKPEVIAPGAAVLSVSTIPDLNFLASNDPDKLALEGWHRVNGGSSMAAPMVAGSAALYLQCQPEADYSDVKTAIINTADVDMALLSVDPTFPNSTYGYGKLNVTQAVHQCLVFGCTDSLASNYNPSAMIDDGSCLLLGIEGQKPENLNFDIFYSSDQMVTVSYKTFKYSTCRICVRNYIGQEILAFPLADSSGSLTFEFSDFPKGLYLISIEDQSQTLATKKMIR